MGYANAHIIDSSQHTMESASAELAAAGVNTNNAQFINASGNQGMTDYLTSQGIASQNAHIIDSS